MFCSRKLHGLCRLRIQRRLEVIWRLVSRNQGSKSKEPFRSSGDMCQANCDGAEQSYSRAEGFLRSRLLGGGLPAINALEKHQGQSLTIIILMAGNNIWDISCCFVYYLGISGPTSLPNALHSAHYSAKEKSEDFVGVLRLLYLYRLSQKEMYVSRSRGKLVSDREGVVCDGLRGIIGVDLCNSLCCC